MIFSLNNCYSQLDSRIWDISEKEENDLVLEIRKEFNNINSNDSKFLVKSKDLDGYSTDGGEMKTFYEQNELKKIMVLYYGESGKVAIDYYVGRMCFRGIYRMLSANVTPHKLRIRDFISQQKSYFNVISLISSCNFQSNHTKIILYCDFVVCFDL